MYIEMEERFEKRAKKQTVMSSDKNEEILFDKKIDN